MSDEKTVGGTNLDGFLNELDAFPWFQHIGERINAANIKQVFSWEDAWECCQDDSWINATFHKEVDQNHPAWAIAYDKALEAVSKSGRNHELEDGVPVALQAAWDAGAAAYQLATNNTNGFYVGLMDWYRKGHWPCGWEGAYPQGRLTVY